MARRDLTLSLSESENVVLSLAAAGEDVLAIGAWEEACKSLAAKGLVQKVGMGYRLTDAGREAFDAMETDEMRGMLEEHNARVGPLEAELLAIGRGLKREAKVIDGAAEEVPDGGTEEAL